MRSIAATADVSPTIWLRITATATPESMSAYAIAVEEIAQRMTQFGQVGHAGDYEARSLADMRVFYAGAAAP